MTERDIFSEVMTSVQELRELQKGKITLKSYKVSRRTRFPNSPHKFTPPDQS